MKQVVQTILAILLISFSSVNLAIPSTTLPETVKLDAKSLSRCSVVPVIALKIFKVGYASLYVENCDTLAENFESTTKQLSFEYYKAIPGDAFNKSATNFLRKNLSAETFEQLEDTILTFNSKYEDIQEGDRYDLRYIPNQGISLYLNDKLVHSEKDETFSRAYFQIWFGEKPFNKKLKRKLLSNEA